MTIPAVTAGNTLVAIITTSKVGTATTATPSGAGATWTRVPATNATDGSDFLEMWYGSGATGGSTTVTITWNAALNAADGAAIKILEYSGVASSSATDGSDGTAGSAGSAAPATNSITTTNANDVLVAAVGTFFPGASNSHSAGPTNSFSGLTDIDAGTAGSLHEQLFAAERIVSATGSYSTGWTLTSSSSWNASILALKAAVASAHLPQFRIARQAVKRASLW